MTHRLRVNKSGDLLVMGKCELLDYCVQQVLLFIGVRKHTPVHEPEVDLPPVSAPCLCLCLYLSRVFRFILGFKWRACHKLA